MRYIHIWSYAEPLAPGMPRERSKDIRLLRLFCSDNGNSVSKIAEVHFPSHLAFPSLLPFPGEASYGVCESAEAGLKRFR